MIDAPSLIDNKQLNELDLKTNIFKNWLISGEIDFNLMPETYRLDYFDENNFKIYTCYFENRLLTESYGKSIKNNMRDAVLESKVPGAVKASVFNESKDKTEHYFDIHLKNE
jgi:hypothetical protein